VITETGGALVITPAAQAGSIGGCVRPNNLPFGSGVIAVVDEVLSGTDTYTVLQVHGPELQIKATGDGFVRFQTSASQDIGVGPYSPDMKYWRIRPATATIVGEYSSDGTNWLLLGIAQVTPPASIGIEISAGTNGVSVMGTGTFDQLVICP
jgi:hypothetical protein